ncbi:hypothetical protein ACFQ5D_09485 [Paenibacillus farraposensis]|uniref:Uncharacterized protein n=1 Tax=Paenibacillus farraposensis TaxID=2807095 RepID=A0ABW4DCD2_9BACL|nr:hypothetical protein [Paenibacillus farraposensis]MCC3379849.1 hypothetical protein [Paenibacillus farraposensis]
MEVTRTTEDGLTQEIWSFRCHPNHLMGTIEVSLGQYTLSNRPSKRHKFSTVKQYDAFRPNAKYRKYIDKDDVPMPDEVKQEIIELIKTRIHLVDID